MAARLRAAAGAAALLVVLLCGVAGEALAQADDLPPRDVYIERGRSRGDKLSLCVNPDAMMASFERALAGEIAARLLLVPNVIDVKTWHPTEPLDYRVPLGYDELYIEFAERCDGFMGFTLAPGYPSWMILSRPYLTTRTVLATVTPAYRKLADIPAGRPIGTRMLGIVDNQLILYLQAQSDKSRWKRLPYFNNKILIDHLVDHSVDAAFVWEPALYRATNGAVDAAGIQLMAPPFDLAPTELGIALRSSDSYLMTTLGEAIDSLAADGTIGALLSAHGLAAKSKDAARN